VRKSNVAEPTGVETPADDTAFPDPEKVADTFGIGHLVGHSVT